MKLVESYEQENFIFTDEICPFRGTFISFITIMQKITRLFPKFLELSLMKMSSLEKFGSAFNRKTATYLDAVRRISLCLYIFIKYSQVSIIRPGLIIYNIFEVPLVLVL